MTTPAKFDLYDVSPYGVISGTLEVADITTIDSVYYGRTDDVDDMSHTISLLLGFREYIVRPRGMLNSEFIAAWVDAVALSNNPPTVTGDTSNNVALADLLTKLDSLGIIVDGT